MRKLYLIIFFIKVNNLLGLGLNSTIGINNYLNFNIVHYGLLKDNSSVAYNDVNKFSYSFGFGIGNEKSIKGFINPNIGLLYSFLPKSENLDRLLNAYTFEIRYNQNFAFKNWKTNNSIDFNVGILTGLEIIRLSIGTIYFINEQNFIPALKIGICPLGESYKYNTFY